MYFILQNKILI